MRRLAPTPLAGLLLLTLGSCQGTGARDGEIRIEVEGRAQRRSLSCESRSAADLAGWYGRPLGEEDVLQALPRSDNPDHGFVGDVDGPGGGLPPDGYGVHEQPVADVLVRHGVPVVASRGRPLAWLLAELQAGRPVIVWATASLDAPRALTRRDAAGRPYDVVPFEHTFLAVGFTPTRVRLLDPATGRVREVARDRFDASWAVLGRRAVSLDPAAQPPRVP